MAIWCSNSHRGRVVLAPVCCFVHVVVRAERVTLSINCRRKSNRESARRSRVRKLEETHESETAIATLQNSVTAQAKMLSVATEHLETMKVCLSQQEQRVGNLCDGVRFLTIPKGQNSPNWISISPFLV